MDLECLHSSCRDLWSQCLLLSSTRNQVPEKTEVIKVILFLICEWNALRGLAVLSPDQWWTLRFNQSMFVTQPSMLEMKKFCAVRPVKPRLQFTLSAYGWIFWKVNWIQSSHLYRLTNYGITPPVYFITHLYRLMAIMGWEIIQVAESLINDSNDAHLFKWTPILETEFPSFYWRTYLPRGERLQHLICYMSP